MQELHLISLLLLLLALPLSASAASLATDAAALLAFKNSSDPTNSSLSSWSPATSPCSGAWAGVSCSLRPPLRVTRLVLSNLSLSGPTTALSSLTSLRLLSLQSTSLSGPLPPFSPSLRLLFLSRNRLSGPLPASLSSLPRLRRLDLSHNLLSGPLNASLLNSISPRLLTLRLDSNRFNGTVSGLHLSHNIQDLNLSNNLLTGAIPPSLSAFPPSSFAGNPGLCGPPLPTPCADIVISSSSSSAAAAEPPVLSSTGMSRAAVTAIVVGDFAVLAMVSGLLLCCFWRKLKNSRRGMQESEKIVYSPAAMVAGGMGGGYNNNGGFERGRMVFLEEGRRFELEDLLRASAEMLGKGGYGTAYRAVLDGGEVVAVKRLREAAGDRGTTAPTRREFEALMEVVGGLRHPNVVGLKAYYFARDEKLLVYEYMAAGSLFSLLHGNRGPGRTPLDWTTRMRIAAGAARGLAYIHHHHHNSKSKLCHGNIKSTNILLDKSLTPKLADSALSPLFPSHNRPALHDGYRAPELLVDPRRPVSQKSDVYAFGVVILEMLTGKAATAAAEEGGVGVGLPQWVQSVVREEWTSEVFDLELMRHKGCEEEMVGMLQVGMACVAAAPDQRPTIGHVLKVIEEIRGGEAGAMASPAYESFGEAEMSSPCVSDDTGTTAGSQ